MSSNSRRGNMRSKADWKCHLGTGTVMALALAGPANAKEFAKNEPRKTSAPVRYLNWSGFYVGGHLGYGRGHSNDSFADPLTAGPSKALGSLFGGVQLGYNHVLNSGVLLGAEGDFSFPNFLSGDDVVRFGITPQGILSEKIDYVGRLRGRFGSAFNNWLVYGTGGFAWSRARFIELSELTGGEDKALRMRGGWVLGAGAEAAIAPEWSARLEYLYDNF